MEPAKGGKVPEAARMRAELNMIDTLGLRDPEGVRMANLMAAESPELLDNMLQVTNSQLQPGTYHTAIAVAIIVSQGQAISISYTPCCSSNPQLQQGKIACSNRTTTKVSYSKEITISYSTSCNCNSHLQLGDNSIIQ